MKPAPENIPDASERFGFLREVLRGAVLNYLYRGAIRRLLAEPEKRVFPRMRPPVLFRYLRLRRGFPADMALSSPPYIFAGENFNAPKYSDLRGDRATAYNYIRTELNDPTDTSDWQDAIEAIATSAASEHADDLTEISRQAARALPARANLSDTPAANLTRDTTTTTTRDTNAQPQTAFDLLNKAAIQLPVIRATDPAPPGAASEEFHEQFHKHLRETVPTRRAEIQKVVRRATQPSPEAKAPAVDAAPFNQQSSEPPARTHSNFPAQIVDRDIISQGNRSPLKSTPHAVTGTKLASHQDATSDMTPREFRDVVSPGRSQLRPELPNPNVIHALRPLNVASIDSIPQPAPGSRSHAPSELASATDETQAAFAQSIDTAVRSRASRSALATDALRPVSDLSRVPETEPVRDEIARARTSAAVHSRNDVSTTKVRDGGRAPVRDSLWRLARIDAHGEKPTPARNAMRPPMPQLSNATPARSATHAPARSLSEQDSQSQSIPSASIRAVADAPVRSHFTQRGFISRPRMRPLR